MLNCIDTFLTKETAEISGKAGRAKQFLDCRPVHLSLGQLSPRALHNRFLGEFTNMQLLFPQPDEQSGMQGCPCVSMILSELIVWLLFLLRSPVIL